MNEKYAEKIYSNMRLGFTIIELIVIIVIIGILAMLAIARMSSTRDDAKLSVTVSNMHICIVDATNHYTATGKDYTVLDHPYSCDEINTVCYDIIYSVQGEDFNVSIDPTGTDSFGETHDYCDDIENVGGYIAKSYDFGVRGVER